MRGHEYTRQSVAIYICVVSAHGAGTRALLRMACKMLLISAPATGQPQGSPLQHCALVGATLVVALCGHRKMLPVNHQTLIQIKSESDDLRQRFVDYDLSRSCEGY